MGRRPKEVKLEQHGVFEKNEDVLCGIRLVRQRGLHRTRSETVLRTLTLSLKSKGTTDGL